ncbi:MAG TPA: amidohydrolase [Dictyoglomaceae bacterium]|nr:amidohydrolase [Dictyoglomaceae bacterium]HOL39198.1 amidohydrolase [Dictyoglomaceae bacterium]HPP15353.1 amidohydrolase [Dictyoglomaceae bacterium]HPU43601.1 amidohydrolase [Dictyoglomaceae bacterium]
MEILIKNGFIFPITSPHFQGDILIKDGKIEAIGINLQNPNAEIIDAKGKFILPGFIDAHSHIGLFEEGVGNYYQDGNEATDPVTPHVKAIDAFNPDDSAIDKALSGGITCVMVLPGSANPIGGQGSIIKFKSKIVDEMIVKEIAGLKMALGENPKRVYGQKNQMPSTRLGTAAIIRNYFFKVQDYINKKRETEKEEKTFLERDLKYEIGEKVLKGEIPARIHAHRKDDILTAIRISEEFDFKLVIEHATEAYKIADYIKSKNIPLILGPLFGFNTKLELKDKTYEAIKILNEKGILTSLMCDHPVIHLEHANIQAGTALRYGANEDDLLKMLTINPAKILGIDDKVGSLEKGKDADIVIWSAHPFDMRSRVEKVFIEGKEVYKE